MMEVLNSQYVFSILVYAVLLLVVTINLYGSLSLYIRLRSTDFPMVSTIASILFSIWAYAIIYSQLILVITWIIDYDAPRYFVAVDFFASVSLGLISTWVVYLITKSRTE